MLQLKGAYRAVGAAVFPVILLLSPATAAGNSLFVSTGGNDANDCRSPATACRTIQTAIDKAPNHSHIHVAAGTYQESLAISLKDDLVLEGEAGTQVVPPVGIANDLVNVDAARAITFRSLRLTGNGAGADVIAGIRVFRSQIVVHDCIVEEFGEGGIVLHRASFAKVTKSIIRRNNYFGLRADASTSMEVGEVFQDETVVIEDNGFQGVAVSGSVDFHGPVEIRGNSVGVLVEGGRVGNCCVESLRITDNEIGVFMQGGHLELRGPAKIESNSLLGVGLRAGASGSFGRFSGGERVLIRNNGTADNPTSAGVLLSGSGLEVLGADVLDNLSVGVLLEDNATMRLRSNTSISGNGSDGVLADRHSTVRVFSGAVLQNNAGADLRCTNESLASGDDTGIGKIKCGKFVKE